ncbi:hypothetical protein C4D60_Mb04t08600 [Musa balbisiana]|uniref:Pentatricopeptide repeat-containing protein n=1 Tax=Musa balbisiana TaxID=52838 RepID=A0A4V6T4R2_MUSBA|nr:hypothetical protein C4D60_Mb04t08600 [Musa balbisiana]
MPISAPNTTSRPTSTSSIVFIVMFRRSSSILLLVNPAHHLRSATPTSSLYPTHSSKPVCSSAGRIADLLEILAPLDHVFRGDFHVKGYVNSLRKCLRSGDHRMVSSLHARLITRGFDSDLLLCNVLMDMYAKVGLMGCSAKLFDGMTERDLISWCTLISGFVRCGCILEAYGAFRLMQRAGWCPNHFVISSVLNACSASGILEMGVLVHGLVIKRGLGFDRFVEVGLVGMYAKCGDLDDALKVFYEIPVKTPVAWNAMISGYFFNGFLIHALELCRDMCRVGFVMDSVTLRVVTAAASALQILELCRNLHVYSIKVGKDADSFVVAELVKLLTALGEVDYIRKLHRKIRKPDASLYSLLISGYHLHGYREEAMKLAEELLNLNLSLNEGALVAILNLCSCKEDGTQIHANFLKSGHLSCLPVGNSLISMYTKFGDMVNAHITFNSMRIHDVVSWTAIIAGLIQNLQFAEAIEVFCAFRTSGILLDQHSVVTVVNACTGLRDVDKGKQIHCLALKLGFELSVFTSASMINMYAKCGNINSAVRLFSCISLPHSIILINVMLAGYCWNFQPEKAIDLYVREHHLGFVPDQFSYSTILSACADMQLRRVGEQIHCCIAKSGFFSDVVTGNALINLYVKCGCMASACKFFYNMKSWNAYSYAILVLGYVENSGSTAAHQVLIQMQQSGLHVKPVSFGKILRSCTDSAAIDLGRQIHASIVKMGLDSDVDMGNALVGVYAESEKTHNFREVTDDMSVREEGMPDYLFAGCPEDAIVRGKNLKAFGLYKLEKVKKGTYSYECLVNPYLSAFATCEMYQNSALPHLDDEHTKYRIHDNSSDMIEDILESRVLLPNSIDNAYEKNVHRPSELHELINLEKVWDNALILVLLGNSKLSLLDERMDYFKPVNRSSDGASGKILCIPV